MRHQLAHACLPLWGTQTRAVSIETFQHLELAEGRTNRFDRRIEIKFAAFNELSSGDGANRLSHRKYAENCIVGHGSGTVRASLAKGTLIEDALAGCGSAYNASSGTKFDRTPENTIERGH